MGCAMKYSDVVFTCMGIIALCSTGVFASDPNLVWATITIILWIILCFYGICTQIIEFQDEMRIKGDGKND